MKREWNIKKLGDIGEIFNGNSINEKVKKEKYTNLNEGINYLATKDIGYDSSVNYTNGIKIPYTEKDNFKLAPAGTVLICAEGGSAGRKIAITNQDIFFGNKLFAFVPSSKNVLAKFIYYYYCTQEFKSHFSSGLSGIIGGVSLNKFKNIDIYLPPIGEQKKIVAIIDKAFEAIDKAKAISENNLKNSKELFESYLTSVFDNKGEGWEEKTLGEIIKLEYGKPLDKSYRKFDGLYPIYGANGEKGRTNKFYYNKKTIIIGRKGSAGALNLTEDKFWPLDVTYFLTFDEKKNDLQFLYYLLSKQQLTKLARGVKPGINRNEVYELTVFIPPLKTQQTIVQELDTLSAETKKLEIIYHQKINSLEELKKLVLHKAFNGELKTSEITV